jgi:hypothetical protein
MQLLRKAFQGLVVAFLALGFLALGPKSSFAFTNGQYNKITIGACVSVTESEFDVLFVVDSNTGGTLVLGDVLQVLAVLPICHPGGAFFAFLNNGAVTNVAIIPGL